MRCCGIVILAAGGSTRMGVAKQSLEFEGQSLLNRAVETAIASLCRPIVVVLGAQSGELVKSLQGLPVTIVVNQNWSDGIGTSIRAGMKIVDETAAAMIFLADQPLLTAQSLDDLVTAHFTSGKLITAAVYGGTVGTPAIFDKSLFDELKNLENGQGGKAVISRYLSQLQTVPLPTAETDVDTPEDYNRLKSSVKKKSEAVSAH